jgi:hypothetical protein
MVARMPFQQIGMKQQVRVLHTGIPRIDSFLGGFQSSRMTLIDSEHPFSFDIVSKLCVGAIKDFFENVVFVDGGNSIDLYTIASLSKRAGLKVDDALSRIIVARAFTAYQLDSIISDRLEVVISKCKPSLLIISSITDLLLDRNIRETEARAILKRSLSILEDITREQNLITILTKRVRLSTSRSLSLNDILYDDVEEIIKINGKRKGIEIHFINRDIVMQYSPVSIHQTTLDEFFGIVRRS